MPANDVPGPWMPEAEGAQRAAMHRALGEGELRAAAARTPEERGYFDETIGATLNAAVAEIAEAGHAEAA